MAEEKFKTIRKDLEALLEEVVASKDVYRMRNFVRKTLLDLKLYREEAKEKVDAALLQIKKEKGWDVQD
jgi:hypothetical protein